MDPEPSPDRLINVALTAFRGPGPDEFRIAATNLSTDTNINNLEVRWWVLPS
jgi:hypothetical protein